MSKAKPATDVTWAEGAAVGDVDPPSPALRNAGYLFGAPLPHDEFNAIIQRIGKHIDALNRTAGGFANITAAGEFLADGESAVVDSYDESLGIMAPTHSDAGTYGLDTDTTIVSSNGVYVALAEIDSTTADEVTVRVFDWALNEMTSVAYTYSTHGVIGLNWCGERLIVTWLNASNETQYDVFDTPASDLSTADRTYSTTGSQGAPLATSKDTFYIADPADATNLIAVDAADVASTRSYTAGSDSFGNGTGYANGYHVVVPALVGGAVEGIILADDGTTLTAQSTTNIDTNRDSEAQFRSNDEFTLVMARDFDGSQHDLFFTTTPFNGVLDVGESLFSNLSSDDEGFLRAEVGGRFFTFITPDEGTLGSQAPRRLLLQRLDRSVLSFYSTMGVYASNAAAFNGVGGVSGPIDTLDEIQDIAITADAVYVSGVAATDTIFRLQLPTPVMVEKSDSSTGLYLHDLDA